jgi:TonB-linked SusC/RagA family outer membrane protein
MKFKLTLLCVGFLLLGSLQKALAQNITVTGKVRNSTGQPLIGATISLEGTPTSTTTDANGNFTIDAPVNTVLIVSFIGSAPQKRIVTSSGEINFTLEPANNTLNDVVVVGYGTQKAIKVSGATATVKSAEIERLNPVRAEDALQGRASGVTVISPGTPGAKPTVLIRGIPSYTGNDPAVIIDGITQSLDDLNAISPADIESITVLKDAATEAIYGLKGGNGVILVTTKVGRKNQKTEFSVNSNYGIQQVANKIGVLNATEYATIVNEGSVASGGNIIFPNVASLGAGTNWQDHIFVNAPVQSYTLSARGGSNNSSYFLSGGYLDQGGIVGGKGTSYFDRANVTANLNFDLTSKLKFIVNTSFVNIKGSGEKEDAINGVISNALNFDPTVPVLNNIPNTYGKYSVSPNILSEIFNPLTELADTHNESNTNKIYGKMELQYSILKNLKITAHYGYTYVDVTSKSFTPLSYYGAAHINSTLNSDGTTKTGDHNSVTQTWNNYYHPTFETFANYDFNIHNDHHFETVLGFGSEQNSGSSLTGTRQDVPFNSWTFADIASATGTTTGGQSVGDSKFAQRELSFFGRINYDYKEKYLASFSARRDGSYAFSESNKYANFYGGSLGWIVSKEKFFKSNVVNFLKARISYGETGNENVSPALQSISTNVYVYNVGQNAGYTFGNNPTSIGATVGSFENDQLSWEKNTQFNGGFDITVLKNKLSFSADYFEKHTSGLLFTPSVSLYLGTAQVPSANIGTTQTKGIDLDLGYNTKIGRDFAISTNLTFTTAKNLVTSTNNGIITGGTYGIPSQTVTRFQQGYTPGYFYGYKTAGLFQTQAEIDASPTQPGAQPGDIKFVDVNHDGKIDDSDRTKIGDPFPRFTMGWSFTISYKGFDFSTFFYASVGNDVYRGYERNLAMTNKYRGVLGRWTGPGSTDNADDTRYSFIDNNDNTRVSDRYVEDGSFLKIKDMQLGYTVTAKIIKRIFSSARIYIQAKNLYTFTKYSGYDPEIPGGTLLDAGIDRGEFPQARSYAMGINFKFQ